MEPATVVSGNVITMDPLRPRAEAVAIANGRIVHVGSVSEAEDAAGKGAEVLRFSHGAIIPGLIDTHNHMLYTGLQSRLVDLSGCRSIAELLAAISRFAQDHPEAQWITSGHGWQIDNYPEPRYPTRQELDQACPDRPVYLNRGGHIGVVSSSALARAGIGRDTPDPPGGRIGRDSHGEPTGMLLEAPAFDLVGHLVPPPSPQERKAALRAAQRSYHAAGICGVIDPGLASGDMAIYQDLWRSGELTMRTVAMPLAQTAEDPDRLLDQLRAWGVRTGFGDERLKLGGFKVFLDGGASLGTALMREPHLDECSRGGIQVTPTPYFRRIAEFCAETGWSLGVHTVGGEAIDIALAVFDEVDREHPIRGLRFTIIHAYVWPTADNMATARRLGVGVALQPAMQYTFAPVLAKRFGAEAFGRATPIRSWLDASVMVGGGSDSPICPFPPLLGIWHAITRYVDDLGQVIGSHQAITPEEALAMYTRNAAWFCFAEHERGMLRRGMLADWVALSVDPLTGPPDAIRRAEVLATAVGGRIVHQL